MKNTVSFTVERRNEQITLNYAEAEVKVGNVEWRDLILNGVGR